MIISYNYISVQNVLCYDKCAKCALLSLPYINDKSEKTAIKLKRLVKEYYNNIGDVPSFIVVDWEATWQQNLSYDFDFVDGYVFSSSF